MNSEQMAGLYFVGAVVVVGAMALWLIELAWKAWRRRQDARADVRWPGRWVEIHTPSVILERAYAQHDMNPHEGIERPAPAVQSPVLPYYARTARFNGDALAGLGECDCDGCRTLRLFKAGK